MMKLENKNPKERRRRVKRLLRGFERRDGVQYLHSDTQGGKLYTTLAALDQLREHDPGTMGNMLVRLDELGTKMKSVQKRLTKAEKEILELGGFQLEQARLVERLAGKWGQKGAERGHLEHE